MHHMHQLCHMMTGVPHASHVSSQSHLYEAALAHSQATIQPTHQRLPTAAAAVIAADHSRLGLCAPDSIKLGLTYLQHGMHGMAWRSQARLIMNQSILMLRTSL
jgi:hypothetical protein